ncbi:DUF4232 domain-containing protein [Mycolicibacterium sp. ELW1]|uniref:DUF4232 domain-containing protein n=1 Tax=Mycobacteriaceae TaxID=1762 RepID=UPI0011F021C3|nr:DUF4232 domain-containing protein [Mycobacterium sp. ELW1]QEN12811.1 DUF4232 domain-containing protein [Mycobacterium sp. ELW1]
MTSARPVLLLTTVVLLAGCSAQQTPSPAPQATPPSTTSAVATPPPGAPTTVTVTATPTTTPQSTPSASGGCAGDDLTVTAGQLQESGAQRQVTVSFTNTSGHACTLVGYPGADLVTPAGGVLINVPRRPANAAHRLTLNPGDVATADVTASAVDSATSEACARWGKLVVTAPNDVVPHTLNVDVPICDATVSSVD